MKKMEVLTEDQKNKIKAKGLAQKYEVSEKYVFLVITGKREANTVVAKAILTDATRILQIIEEPTTHKKNYNYKN